MLLVTNIQARVIVSPMPITSFMYSIFGLGFNSCCFVGSRSLIIQLLNLNLIDELQLCVQPVIAGKGLSLFENVNERTIFKLKKTKNFMNGAIILYYEPIKGNK